MGTSKKTPASIRQGGPGFSHQSAKAPHDPDKGEPDHPLRQHSQVSGGGGEADSHHTHDPDTKGGENKRRKADHG